MFRRLEEKQLIAAAAAFFLVLASCRSGPELALPAGGGAAYLPEGRLVYASARAADNRELVRKLLDRFEIKTQGVRYLADNSRMIHAAVAPELVLVAEGGFSRGLIDVGLGMDKSWRKAEVKAGGASVEVWRSRDLSMAIPSDELVVAWTTPAGDRSSSTESAVLERLYGRPERPALSEAVMAALRGHDVAVYIPSDSGSFDFPLRHASAYLDRSAGADYELTGLLAAAESRDPRILNVLVRVVMAGWLSSLGVKDLKTVQSELVVSVEGSNVALRGLKFSPADLIELAAKLAGGGGP